MGRMKENPPDRFARLTHVAAMSKAEILDEIRRLTPDERDEIRQTLDELDDPLSAEEWTLVDARIEEHRSNPASAVPIEEMKATLRARFSR
jgi:putative addiction module component (TIGR02574 family)